MTVIAGIFSPTEGCWIGTDRQVTCGGTPLLLERKMFGVGRWIVAVSGAMSAVNMLERIEAERLAPKSAADLAAILRENMEKDGFVAVPDKRCDGAGPKSYDQSFLAASADGLYEIDGFLSVLHIPWNKLWARGSGADYAIGAGIAYAEAGYSPEKRLRGALKAAIASDIHCGGNAQVMCVRRA